MHYFQPGTTLICLFLTLVYFQKFEWLFFWSIHLRTVDNNADNCSTILCKVAQKFSKVAYSELGPRSIVRFTFNSLLASFIYFLFFLPFYWITNPIVWCGINDNWLFFNFINKMFYFWNVFVCLFVYVYRCKLSRKQNFFVGSFILSITLK